MQVLTMAFIAFFLVWGCQNSGMTEHEKNAINGQGDADMENIASIPKIMKPPIDLTAPAKTGTATFALG